MQHGLALSGTVHWLFDRHLISITKTHELLISPTVPTILRPLLRPPGQKVHLPNDTRLWPEEAYLARHRELFQSLNATANLTETSGVP